MKTVLIIEDDKTLLQTLSLALEAEQYRVLASADGREGLELALREKPDLAVMDWMLPGMTGLEICRSLRLKAVRIPIIILSGKKKEEADKVIGLELGADDYLVKPFGTREFVARVKAVLRRSEEQAAAGEVPEEYAFGDVRLSFKRLEARRGDTELHLTSREFDLLKLLIAHEGEVVSRDTILNKVWGYDRFPTTRTVDTFIHNLRKKLEEDPARPRHLLTVPWAGYKFQK